MGATQLPMGSNMLPLSPNDDPSLAHSIVFIFLFHHIETPPAFLHTIPYLCTGVPSPCSGAQRVDVLAQEAAEGVPSRGNGNLLQRLECRDASGEGGRGISEHVQPAPMHRASRQNPSGGSWH